MTIALHALVIDCADAARVAAFWAAVLGRTVDSDPNEEFASIGMNDDAPESRWMFVKVPEPRAGKNRLHVDLIATDPAELDRLVELGAKRLNDFDEDGEQWTTLADPEGNEFDLLVRKAN